jgi:hypothetical protein
MDVVQLFGHNWPSRVGYFQSQLALLTSVSFNGGLIINTLTAELRHSGLHPGCTSCEIVIFKN